MSWRLKSFGEAGIKGFTSKGVLNLASALLGSKTDSSGTAVVRN